MSLCERCPLFLAESGRCKVGKRVHELYCETYDYWVGTPASPDDGVAEIAPEIGKPDFSERGEGKRLQIGKPWPRGILGE